MSQITKQQIETLLLGKIVKVDNESKAHLNRRGRVKQVRDLVDGGVDVLIGTTWSSILPDTITETFIEGQAASWLLWRRKFTVVDAEAEPQEG
jgi:hypothetical protein